MAFRTDVTINWQVSPRIVTVESPSVTIVNQDLHDTLVGLEDTIEGAQFSNIISSSGKEVLGGGIQVGHTLTLLDARLRFAARSGPITVQCTVSGGNIVAVDALGSPISPIEPTAFTQVVIAQSSSATLATQDTLVDYMMGGRYIDIVGNDSLGWQRVERDMLGIETHRYNLMDETGTRITGTVAAFLDAKKMIAHEVLL